LYKNTTKINITKLELDLCGTTTDFYGLNISHLIKTYYNFLLNQLKIHGFEKEQISSVIIKLEFAMGEKRKDIYNTFTAESFLCTVSITDELGKVFTRQRKSFCWQHSFLKETRSCRRDSNS